MKWRELFSRLFSIYNPTFQLNDTIILKCGNEIFTIKDIATNGKEYKIELEKKN